MGAKTGWIESEWPKKHSAAPWGSLEPRQRVRVTAHHKTVRNRAIEVPSARWDVNHDGM